MLTHIEQRALPYSAMQMFDLVSDVARYPEFAPWCIASRVTRRESAEIFYADLIVGYKMFREKFSSKVVLRRPESGESGQIDIEYLHGPLKHLKNHWRFIDCTDGSCIVDFSVEFEFKNRALQSLSHMFFHEVVRRMVGAFEARAMEIYGTSRGVSSSPL